MNHGSDAMLHDADEHLSDGGLNPSPSMQTTSPYPSGAANRRRPIVVRDPKTGDTRFVYGGAPRNGGPAPVSGPGANGGGRGGSGYRGGFDDYADRPAFDDHRAPVVKIVSGYRGRQIVVRDPARRTPSAAAPVAPSQLGVREGGVRKSNYYDRRSARSPPYSPDEYEGRGRGNGRGDGRYYDEEDDEDDGRLYGRDRDSDYDRSVDHHMGGTGPEYGDRYESREFYRGGSSHDAAPAHEDLTGKVVYVDNLSDDVTTTGLADLFGMVGAVKELRLLYDRQGNPNGSADIVFQRRIDAEEAIKSLHNVPLNNRPMRLSMGNGL